MAKKVLIFAKRKKAAAQQAREKLHQWLKKKNIEALDVSETKEKLSEEMLKGVKFGVVIGGDGTFLTLVRRMVKKDQFPLMGVNLGTLGFITEVGNDEMMDAVGDALDGKYNEEKRQLMEVEVWRNKKCVETGIVFNDAVISKDATTSMLKMDVCVGGDHLSLVRADGYIVSTPTGSTAYSLSSGGPLLHPDVDGIVLMAICPHALSARPIIVPQRMEIEIVTKEFSGGSVYLLYDGQISFELKADDVVKMRNCATKLRLIRSPKLKWTETLRTKLKMA